MVTGLNGYFPGIAKCHNQPVNSQSTRPITGIGRTRFDPSSTIAWTENMALMVKTTTCVGWRHLSAKPIAS
jgi:hypothetical protein